MNDEPTTLQPDAPQDVIIPASTSWFWGALANAWAFFDGRKTAIGGAMLGLSVFLQGATEIVQATNDRWQLTINLLAYTGGWITTGGAVHKIAKNQGSTTAS